MATASISITVLNSGDQPIGDVAVSFDTTNPAQSFGLSGGDSQFWSSSVLSSGKSVFVFSTAGFVGQVQSANLDGYGGARYPYQIYGLTVETNGSSSNAFEITPPYTGRYGDHLYLFPNVNALRNGGYVVTWEDQLSSGQSNGIYLRTFNSANQPNSRLVLVDKPPWMPWVYSSQPIVQEVDTNNFIVTWRTVAGATEIQQQRTAVNIRLAGRSDATLTGGSGPDYLYGWEGKDDLHGGNDDDFLAGEIGNDTLEGESGSDLIEGGEGDDQLAGGTGNDTVKGGTGRDKIKGGDGEGDDVYDGEDGVDQVTYTSALAPILVDLTAGIARSLGATDANIGTDTLSNIEDVLGGSFGDSIVGSSADNVLDGAEGNDTLFGGAGSDTLIGGDGTDIAVFSGNYTSYTITVGQSELTVESQSEGTDVLRSVEALRFADGDRTVQSLSNSGSSVSTSNSNGSSIPICFARGTQIRGQEGLVLVESLHPRATVIDHDSKATNVKWIGHQRRTPEFAQFDDYLPVKICAGALEENVPVRDLYLSPDHAVLVDGHLIHAQALVNGRTIIKMTEWQGDIEYYHIETENHEIIFAEGVPCETFIDNVSREQFDNYAEYQALYPYTQMMRELPLPRVKFRRQMPSAIWRRLMERADLITAAQDQA